MAPQDDLDPPTRRLVALTAELEAEIVHEIKRTGFPLGPMEIDVIAERAAMLAVAKFGPIIKRLEP